MSLLALLLQFIHIYADNISKFYKHQLKHHHDNTKLYNLVVVTFFKNEAWNIKEFLDHYIDEGVEHFYMIDNGSTDEYMHIIINNFPVGLVTIIRDDSYEHFADGLQDHLIRKYFHSLIVHDANWVIVVDLDEFIYSTGIDRTISSTLEAFPLSVSRLFLFWKTFGGNHIMIHPRNTSLVQAFNHRAEFTINHYQDAIKNGAGLYGCGKMIVRVSPSLQLEAHASTNGPHQPVYIPIYNHSIPLNHSDYYSLLLYFNEDTLHKHVLHLNHYAFQSREYYEKNKAPRGGGQSGHTNKYTVEYYDAHANTKENNLIYDNNLYLKKLKRVNTSLH